MLEGKAGMAAALSVMGSSAVSLPALAGLPHSGPSLQRLSEAGEGSDFGSSVPAPGGTCSFRMVTAVLLGSYMHPASPHPVRGSSGETDMYSRT
jgi:hypothetical protein